MVKNGKLKEKLISNQMIILYLIIALSLAIGFTNNAFFDFSSVVSISRAALLTMIFAILEMMVITSGGIDVSFPAIACASMYIPVQIMTENDIDSMFFAVGIAVVIGLVFGAVNAILISKLRIPPLIATLGMSSIISGGLVGIFGATEISRLPEPMVELFRTYLFTYTSPAGLEFSLTILILVPVVLIAIVALILRYTTLGRGIYAIGGNLNAAKTAGFNVTRIHFFVYMFVGAFVGVAAIVSCVLNRSASPVNLMGTEMMVIAAVVIGGTRITGGHGTIVGTILGVLLISLIRNNLIMLGVPAHWQPFILGLLIVAGTSLTSLKAMAVSRNAKI